MKYLIITLQLFILQEYGYGQSQKSFVKDLHFTFFQFDAGNPKSNLKSKWNTINLTVGFKLNSRHSIRTGLFYNTTPIFTSMKTNVYNLHPRNANNLFNFGFIAGYQFHFCPAKENVDFYFYNSFKIGATSMYYTSILKNGNTLQFENIYTNRSLIINNTLGVGAAINVHKNVAIIMNVGATYIDNSFFSNQLRFSIETGFKIDFLKEK